METFSKIIVTSRLIEQSFLVTMVISTKGVMMIKRTGPSVFLLSYMQGLTLAYIVEKKKLNKIKIWMFAKIRKKIKKNLF